jgi:hypothetical protein
MMFFPGLTVLTAAFLAATPLMWPHAPVHTALILIGSAVGAAAVVAAILDRRFRGVAVAAGSLIVLAGFAFSEAKGTASLDLTAGWIIMLGGLAPEVRRIPVTAARSVPEPEELRRAA